MGDEALCAMLSRYLLCQQPEGHKAVGIAVAVSLPGWHASGLLR